MLQSESRGCLNANGLANISCTLHQQLTLSFVHLPPRGAVSCCGLYMKGRNWGRDWNGDSGLWHGGWKRWRGELYKEFCTHRISFPVIHPVCVIKHPQTALDAPSSPPKSLQTRNQHLAASVIHFSNTNTIPPSISNHGLLFPLFKSRRSAFGFYGDDGRHYVRTEYHLPFL